MIKNCEMEKLPRMILSISTCVNMNFIQELKVMALNVVHFSGFDMKKKNKSLWIKFIIRLTTKLHKLYLRFPKNVSLVTSGHEVILIHIILQFFFYFTHR